MKKVVIERPGDFDQLVLVEGPTPEPGKGEVRIAVRAAGVNFADCLVRMGIYPGAPADAYPLTPGMEVAGVVDAVGAGVTRWRAGDAVIAVGPFGGYATHLVAAEDYVFSMPTGLDFVQAAAIPRVFLPAYFGLHELARIRAGDRVLLHGAAGGVGSAALQIAKLAGAQVIAVVGKSAKVAYAQELGADEVIDRSVDDVWAKLEQLVPEGVDVVMDPIGGETAERGYNHLAVGGRIVLFGMAEQVERGTGEAKPRHAVEFSLRRLMGDNRAVMGFTMGIVIRNPKVLARLWQSVAELVVKQGLRMPKVTTFSLADAAGAHRALQSGETTGKLVLTIGDEL